MTIDDSDIRADDLTAAMARLGELLVDGQDLRQTLTTVADLAVQAIPDCAAAGVTLLDEQGKPDTAAYSDRRTLAVDRAQYEVGDGPCLEAYRTGQLQRIRAREVRERWPRFAEAAEAAGVESFLASALTVRGERIGALNLYSGKPDGFDLLDEALILAFAGQASVAVMNTRLYQSCTELNHQLETALLSRAVIDQAKGVLMARHRVTADAAFDLLRAQSQRSNRKLRDIAHEVVASVLPD